MPEAGGPTTQSGIDYQNSITALYLGRLLDSRDRPSSDRVEYVRTEAPENVDDTVVKFADGHVLYIQAKESIASSSKTWANTWRQFDEQFRDSKFQKGHDRIALVIGRWRDEHDQLSRLCEPAKTSESYEEWLSRLTQAQKDLLLKIKPHLIPTGLTDDHVFQLLKHVDVEIIPTVSIRRDKVLDWMPRANRTAREVFALLLERIGQGARVRQSYTANNLRNELDQITDSAIQFEAPEDFAQLRDSLAQSSSLLHQQRNSFGETGIHIERQVVAQIVEWLTDEGDVEKNVAMLLDQAGMGKTVVMRDALAILSESADVLAIKADQQLNDVSTLDQIQHKLGLPDSPISIVSRLATERRVIVLIDQVDALSLSMAHDQSALDIVIDLIARLQRIPNVRILMSCRIFDRNSDPRLKKIELGKSFTIPKLETDEIDRVLSHLQIDISALSTATRDLLATPLHLDLFTRAIERGVPTEELRGIVSLQELYHLIWQEVVMREVVNEPSKAERNEAIQQITVYMDEQQRISVPATWLFSADNAHLENAFRWLASQGILQKAHTSWTFLHQTFFDYCYARQFVDQGGDIVKTVLESKQGIHIRPKLLQIITYLRSFDHRLYIHSLTQLFRAESLRFHLRDLLFRWFGAIPNPTDDEWALAQRLIIENKRNNLFFQAMYGNSGWLKYLRPSLEKAVKSSEQDARSAYGYITSLTDVPLDDIVKMILPSINIDKWHEEQVQRILFRHPFWRHPDVQNLFETQIYKTGRVRDNEFWQLQELSQTAPAVACRVLRCILDTMLLDRALESLDTRNKSGIERLTRSNLLFDLIRGEQHGVTEIIKRISEAVPNQFVDEFLDWCLVVVDGKPQLYRNRSHYLRDDLSYNWHGDTFRTQLAFVNGLIGALETIARVDRKKWLRIVDRLTPSDFATPHQLIAHVYIRVAEQYPSEILDYLLGDERRFQIGHSAQYDSWRLIKAVFPHLNSSQRQRLESAILAYREKRHESLPVEYWSFYLSGIEQFRLLDAIPFAELSPLAQKRNQEWQRKYPDFEPPQPPVGAMARVVESPIDESSTVKMSDRSWLRAFSKYQNGNQHPEFFKGGAGQLSSTLQKAIEANPERFNRLMLRTPLDLDESYIRAFIEGFAASPATAEFCYEAIRRFADRLEGTFVQRQACWSIQKLYKHGVPDDILELAIKWATSEIGQDEIEWERDDQQPTASHVFINCDRGAAFETAMRILRAADTDASCKKLWKLLEFAARDTSTVLKVGAIDELSSMINKDRERAFKLFNQMVDDKQLLLREHDVREFVYWMMYKNFKRVYPYIQAMMHHPDEEVQKRGAELACIAAFSHGAMEDEEAASLAAQLEKSVLCGKETWRRGAARIYCYNLREADSTQLQDHCESKLTLLLDDPDKKVRETIDWMFNNLEAKHFTELREFIELYACSEQRQHSRHIAKFLWEYGILDPAWSLELIQTLVMTSKGGFAHESGMEQLMRLTLRIHDAAHRQSTERQQSLDAFDMLMEQYAGTANKVIAEWEAT